MKNNKSFGAKVKKISNIVLIILLVIGILCTGFGASVLALTPSGEITQTEDQKADSTPEINPDTDVSYVDPTKDYTHLKNEAVLSDDVKVLSKEDSAVFNSSVREVLREDGYDDEEIVITLEGKEHEELKDIEYGDLMYLQGDEDTCFGGDRIFRVSNKWRSGDNTKLRVTEPAVDEVFSDLSFYASEGLTQSNCVGAEFLEGVTGYFGDIDDSAFDLAKTTVSSGAITAQGAKALANDSSTEGNDVVVKFNVDFSEFFKKDDNKNDKETEEEETDLDTAFGIKGEIGLKDLHVHAVYDVENMVNFKDVYLGVSGRWVADVELFGEIESKNKFDTGERNYKYATLSGLSEKRFPLMILEFKGTKPVVIKHSEFEKDTKSITPKFFILVYSDWEGSISFEVSAGFEASAGFNNGFSLFKDGKFNGKFESYPYAYAMQEEPQKSFEWDFEAALTADTEITAVGAGVVFYIGGVNIGEIAALKLGVQAQGEVSVTASSKDGVSLFDSDKDNRYIRFFVKIIDVKFKLKVDGKEWFDAVDFSFDSSFLLYDLTLFEVGSRPDKFKNKVPASSMIAPTEFDSVITMVCDVSGSMDEYIATGETKLYAAQSAAKVIVDSTDDWSAAYDGVYGIGIVQFSDNALSVSIPHIDYRYLKECIDIIGEGNGTNIAAGINTGVEQLSGVKSDSKVMILLTDGRDDNDTEVEKAAKNAKENGIKIYTIGFGENVNETVLKSIAEITQGEYKFASTENIVSIIGTFIYAQQSANAQVLTDFEGTVAQGETTEEETFEVEDENGDLIVTTAWPGSFLDTILVDPKGRVVDENYPDAVTDETKIPSTITVKNPMRGEWTVKIKGVETSYEKEPFYTIVSFKEALGEVSKLNAEMTALQKMATYLIPIGAITAVVSAMLLYCINKKPKTKKISAEDTSAEE